MVFKLCFNNVNFKSEKKTTFMYTVQRDVCVC